MTTLATITCRAGSDGILVDFFGEMDSCVTGRLATDLGQGAMEEVRLIIIALVAADRCGGNVDSRSLLSAQELVENLQQEKVAKASQRLARFVVPQACSSHPRHQNDRNAVAEGMQVLLCAEMSLTGLLWLR
jgi:hypothetical protein